MINYITLFLIFWAMIYSAARFLKYFRIVKDYKDETEATVLRISGHTPLNKKEIPAIEVVLGYTIDGREGSTEIIVPESQAERYEIGKKIAVCYHVSENGTVNIASAGGGPKKMMYGYLAAIILEVIVYAVVWRILL